MVNDGDARRLRDVVLPHIEEPTLRHWFAELLQDRHERIGLLLQLSRQLHHLGGRVGQAAGYLQGLVREAQTLARSPWPEKIPCEVCGAPPDHLSSELAKDRIGHVMVTYHLDGRRCVHPAQRDGQAPATE